MIRSLSGPGARAPRNATLRGAFTWLAVVALAVPGPLHAQETEAEDAPEPSAGEILAEMLEREARRSEGLDRLERQTRQLLNYPMQAEGMGIGGEDRLPGHHQEGIQEKIFCKLPSGETLVEWRNVSITEVASRREFGQDAGTSHLLRSAGDSVAAAGVMFNEGLAEEGVPVGLLTLVGLEGPMNWGGRVEDPAGGPGDLYMFSVLNPGSYFGAYELFFNAMADGADMVNSLRSTAASACKQGIAQREAMRRDMVNVGRTQVGDREAFHLEATMNEVFLIEEEPETELTLRKATLEVDTEHYVPLRIRLEATVVSDGEPKPLPVIIEKENKLYRLVPDSDMLLPYLEVMRIWGFQDLGPEMEEAQREMAKLEAQLAELPPSHRAIVEKAAGDKIRAMKAMAEGGAMVYETRIEEIILNPDLPHNPTSATNPIVLECMPDDTDCVEPDAETAKTAGADAAPDTDSDPATTED